MPHYFDEQPAAGRRSGAVRLRARGLDLELRTDRGVFSADRVDPGTAVLLELAPDPPQRGALLDLGCGYGPIALCLAALAPAATVWAVDVNERARELCARNVAAAGLDNVRVVSGDEVPDGVRFAAVWSNPPVRVGKAVLHDLLAHWLDQLEPAGQAYLVVQRHLGADSLQRWLADRGWPTDRVGSRRGFRVLRCRAPVTSSQGAR